MAQKKINRLCQIRIYVYYVNKVYIIQNIIMNYDIKFIKGIKLFYYSNNIIKPNYLPVF